MQVKVEKTKISKPDRPYGVYRISFDTGIEWVYDLYDVLVSYGVIVQSGSWVNFVNPNTGEYMDEYKVQGRIKAVELLKENEYLLEMYLQYTENQFK